MTEYFLYRQINALISLFWAKGRPAGHRSGAAADAQDHHKPLITVAIRKRRKQKTLEEYRRKFSLPSYKVAGADAPRLTRPSPPSGQSRHQARETRSVRSAAAVRQTRSRLGWGRRTKHFSGAARAFVVLALLRSYHGLFAIAPRKTVVITAAIAGFSLMAGLYGYKFLSSGDTGGAGRSKRSYDRLAVDIAPLAGVSLAPERRTGVPVAHQPAESAPPFFSAPKSDPDAAALPEPAAPGPFADKAIAVHSERYLPDGTPVSTDKRPPAPSELPSKSAETTVKPSQEADDIAPVAPPLKPEAEPLPASDHAYLPSAGPGYFAQLKSDQSEKSAAAEVEELSQKYKAVLKGIELLTKQADLKEKGIWYRILAGPLGSRDEAGNLCKRLKSAGHNACIVQTLEEQTK